MDRNTIIGLLLIAVILVGYSLITKKSRQEMAEEQRIRDSIQQLEQLKMPEQSQQAEEVIPLPSDTGTDKPESEEISETVEPSAEEYRDLYGAFAEAASGSQKFITMENNLIKFRVSTRGGRPYSVQLKEYQTYDSLPLILFDGDSTVFGMNFFAQNRTINTNEVYFTPDTDESFLDASNSTVNLSMRLPAGEGRYIEYIYSLEPESYMVDFKLRFINVSDLLTINNNFIDLNWNIYVPQQEMGRMNELNYTTIFLKHFQDEVERLSMRTKKEMLEKDIPTKVRWLAFKQQFFSSVFIADESFTNAYIRSAKLDENPSYLYTFESTVGIPYAPAAELEQDYTFYFGPNHYNTLKTYGMELQDLVGLGGLMSRVINKYAIIPVFNFLDNSIKNYGLIILILTIMIKLVLFPLTYRSYISMAKMRVLKPEIDEINARIPKDKSMERQQATMALYKKAGVSPLGGCLPVILQMPILIAMFRFFPTSIELRQQSFLWAHDLSTYDSILDLPFNIPMYGDHISLFTLLMTASTILTMKISNQANAQQSSMPGMKGMMYIMPIMFMFMLNNWSAALTYYYFLANIITFGQNQLVKQFVDEEALRKKLKSNQKKPAAKKKSGFQKRLEDMAKQRGYQPPKKKK